MTSTVRPARAQIVLILQMAFCIGAGIFNSTAVSQLTDEDKSNFNWFDQLDYANFEKRPFVKVSTGLWTQIEKHRPKNTFVHGFLLNETEKNFTVITLKLDKRTFVKTPAKTPAHLVVKFEKTGLAEFTKVVFDQHLAYEMPTGPLLALQPPPPINDVDQLFVLAKACFENRKTKEAARLIAIAKTVASRSRDASLPKISFQKSLSAELENSMRARLVRYFGDRSKSRRKILREFKIFQIRFAESTHIKWVKEMVAILTKMIEEDATHKKLEGQKPKSAQARIAELIFQLRDQGGTLWRGKYFADLIWNGTDGEPLHESNEKKSKNEKLALVPAIQLAQAGFHAVPQLIKALDDKRLTRIIVVGHPYMPDSPPRVLSVGQCARRILDKIAGRYFTNQAEIKAWWKEIQAKGEKQFMIDAIINGDDYAVNYAKRLVKEYPDEALKVIIKGFHSSQSTWISEQLIELAGKLDNAAPFLKKQLNARHLSTRIVAAHQLDRWNPQTALNAMIEEWKKIVSRGMNPHVSQFSIPDDVKSIIEFLAIHNNPKAIEALGHRFSELPIHVRMYIVVNLINPNSLTSTEIGEMFDVPEQTVKRSPKTQKAIETVLVRAMECGSQRGDFPLRLGDISAAILAGWFPEKYEFDLKGNFEKREKQRIVAINKWRSKNRLPKLAEFKPRKITRLRSAKTSALLQAIVSAKNDRERQSDTIELEKLGIGALPAVLETIKTLDGKHPAHQDLKQLASQLASTVTSIKFAKDSVPLDAKLKKQVLKCQDRPLQAKEWIAILVEITKQLPAGASGIKMIATRETPESGIELTVMLTKNFVRPERAEVPNPDAMWAISGYICVDQKIVDGFGGAISLEMAEEPRSFAKLEKSLKKTLDKNPTQHIEASYLLIKQQPASYWILQDYLLFKKHLDKFR